MVQNLVYDILSRGQNRFQIFLLAVQCLETFFFKKKNKIFLDLKINLEIWSSKQYVLPHFPPFCIIISFINFTSKYIPSPFIHQIAKRKKRNFFQCNGHQEIYILFQNLVNLFYYSNVNRIKWFENKILPCVIESSSITPIDLKCFGVRTDRAIVSPIAS